MPKGQQPETETMKASEARQQWSSLLNQVFRRERRVVIEKSGIPVAAIVSTADLERLERYDRQRRERGDMLDTMRAAFDGVGSDEIEREVARALAEVRAERRGGEENPPSAHTA